ncbi:MAG TPA: hypothetical protein VKT77_20550 [Chthonomonadaceae bacterium]|nr:hypothetical protein [Chthonomonadaceae bacterium]
MAATTYIERQVDRTNRNLLLINGGCLGAQLLFFGLMVAGGLLIAGRMHAGAGGLFGPSAPADMSRAERIRPADIAAPDRLAALLDHAVTLDDPATDDVHFPVFDWMGRSRGAGSMHAPPTYHLSRLGGGHVLLILPATATPGTEFTGVIRKIAEQDRGPATAMLMSRPGSGQLGPYMLDCLTAQAHAPKGAPVVMHPVGKTPEQSPVVLLMTVALIGVPARNVVKAIGRMRNRMSHPVYKKLAVYGPPLEVAWHIDAERAQGIERLSPAEMTASWLLAPSLFGIEVVNLDHIVWMFVRMTRLNLVPVITGLGIMDREGKGHPIYAGVARSEEIMETIRRRRPWIVTGYNRDRFGYYTKNRAAFVAEVDARRAGGRIP